MFYNAHRDSKKSTAGRAEKMFPFVTDKEVVKDEKSAMTREDVQAIVDKHNKAGAGLIMKE